MLQMYTKFHKNIIIQYWVMTNKHLSKYIYRDFIFFFKELIPKVCDTIFQRFWNRILSAVAHLKLI